MGKIMARYLLRIFFPTFALCLAFFIAALFMSYFLRLFGLAMLKGISMFWIAACFARLSPLFLSLALPMSFLVALLLTLGSLGERGEILALRASGFAFLEMTKPFLIISLGLSSLLLYINHKAGPEAFHSFRKRTLEAGRRISSLELSPRVFMRLGPWSLYADSVDAAAGSLKGVYLVYTGSNQTLRIEAPRGHAFLQKGRGFDLELQDGSLVLANPDPETLTRARFRRYRVFLPLAVPGGRRDTLDIQEMASKTLRAKIKDSKTDRARRLEYAAELAARSAGALSPFVFFWIAAPLGLRVSRNSRSSGLALALAVLFIFYGLMALGTGLGRRQELLSWLAPWLADGFGLAAGAWLTRKYS